MSSEAVALALHHSRATGVTKLVLIGIANHDGDGGAWPSIATLATYAGKSERTVQRAIDELEALGEIRVEQNAGGGKEHRNDRRPNRYEVLLRCPDDCDGTKNHRPKKAQDGVTPVSPREADGVSSVSPRESDEVTPVSPRNPERGDTRVANGVTPVSPELVLEQNLFTSPSVGGEFVAPQADATPIDDEAEDGNDPETKRGTRLPAKWAPTKRSIDTILSEHPTLTIDHLRAEHRSFADHWASASGRTASKRNWDAAWRNWMRKTDWSRAATVHTLPTRQRPQYVDPNIAALNPRHFGGAR